MKKYNGDQWTVPQTTELIADIGTISFKPAREITTTIRRQIQGDEPKILWLTDQVPEGGYEKIEGAEFEHVKAWSKGRQDSMQGVFFGRLALGQEIETPVAVKPYFSAPNAGAHESAMLLYLHSKGLRTYQLLGMSWSSEQGYAMITSFEEESKSLDNVNWSKSLSEPLGRHLTNLEAIEQVGESLGLMHGNGIIHNDAQIKNFAVNGNEVVLMDLTSARLMFDENGNFNESDLLAGMYRDKLRLVESLRDKSFLRDASDMEWVSFYTNVIATAYRSGLFRAGDGLAQYGVDVRALSASVVDDISTGFTDIAS